MKYIEDLEGGINKESIQELISQVLSDYTKLEKVLVIHPDYTRDDFTDLIFPTLLSELKRKGLKELHTLNASGTHRKMSEKEMMEKLGLEEKPDFVYFHNHEFDDPRVLMEVGKLPAEFVFEKTQGELRKEFPVTVNKMVFEDFDLIIAISGTVPHEATGYSGALKIFIPGIAGPDVVGLFHWVAVLIGIPRIIGSVDNPARDVINESCSMIFKRIKADVLSFNMVFEEGERIIPKGLYIGEGYEGFLKTYRLASKASSKLHVIYLDEPLDVAVQVIGPHYDEFWTAGKGSYKLQRPGVMKDGGEIIIYAPHIKIFHSNRKMDEDIRTIGYHCKDYVVDFLRKHPDFDRNVAAHVINVRGPGRYDPESGKEEFSFKVTLATGIPKEVCEAVGLGYRDPKTIKEEDFKGRGKLWIKHGGKYLYDLKR